jgi:DNA-binding NtrC family response regulator
MTTIGKSKKRIGSSEPINRIGITKNRSGFSPTDKSMKGTVDNSRQVLISSYLMANLKDSCFNFNEFMKNFEKQIIESALILTHYNQRRASYILGLKPTTLNEKIKKHKISIKNPEIKDIIKFDFPPFSKH